MPFRNKARGPASYYPKPIFHGVRLAQLVSSIIVFSIMAYFIYYLVRDGFAVPWTFIWLELASVLSFLVLVFTMVLHCCTGLHPHLNILLNGGLLALWLVSWSLLTWWMGHTLRNWCDVNNWNEELGIMICRIYKALFTFTLTGLVSTAAAFGLDVFVLRNQRLRGAYHLQELDRKPGAMPHVTNTAYEPSHGAYQDSNLGPSNYAEGGIQHEPRVSEAWDATARPYFDPHAEQKDGERLVDAENGYEDHPYRDGAYSGGHRGTASRSDL